MVIQRVNPDGTITDIVLIRNLAYANTIIDLIAALFPQNHYCFRFVCVERY